MTQIYDTIILGAGWAGAVAARELAQAGRSVLVLEARERVGGRAKTWRAPEAAGGVGIDVGCSWIHGYREGNPARGIAQGLGVNAHLPKPAEGVIYGPKGPLSKTDADALRANLGAAQAALKLPHPAPPSSASLASALLAPSSLLFGATSTPPANPDDSTVSATNPSDPSSTDVPAGSPSAVASASSGSSVDPALAADFARTLEVPLGLKLEHASLRWSGWESTTNFAGSDAAPGGGYEALVAKVLAAAEANGAEVKVGHVVVGVQAQDGDGGVSVRTKDGASFVGKTVISTIPLGTLKALPAGFFSPALPPALQETIAGTHVGVLEKLLLQYPTAWWPEAHSTGSYTFLPTLPAASLSSSSSAKDIFSSSTLICANFACPSLPNPSPTLLTYLSETPARLLSALDSTDVAHAYHAFLVERFQSSTSTPAPPAPSASALTNWLTDEFSRGATTTPSVVSPHGERSPLDFKELGRPVWAGKLGFAGEHTEMENRGSVAGAVLSGQREAARVQRLLDVWEGK